MTGISKYFKGGFRSLILSSAHRNVMCKTKKCENLKVMRVFVFILHTCTRKYDVMSINKNDVRLMKCTLTCRK